MTKITSELLNNTLNVVQLAREMALARGSDAQAEKLTPVAEDLRSIMSSARHPTETTSHAGLMEQSGFQKLLQAVQSQPQAERTGSSTNAADATDRNQVVRAMSAAGMADMDIARHMGIARDEVRLILSIGQKV